MNYIQIYENFINNRLKLLKDIELNDDRMLEFILDLMPDTLEVLDYDFGNIDTLGDLGRDGYERDSFISLGLKGIIKNKDEFYYFFAIMPKFVDREQEIVKIENLKSLKSDLYRLHTNLSEYDIHYVLRHIEDGQSFIESLDGDIKDILKTISEYPEHKFYSILMKITKK